MPHPRFHTEPTQADVPHTICVTNPEFSVHTDSRPALETLLLGLHFRDWLTESDQRFLRWLAPGRILLMADDHMLFPTETEALCVPDFAPSILHHPDAVFTHRVRFGGPDTVPCEMHTARIGTIGGCELMLGLAEPDRQWDRSVRVTGFESQIAEWRTALKSAARTFTELHSHLNQGNPYLVVNRASGRVVAADEQLCRLLGGDNTTVVDKEFSTLSDELHQIVNTRGLHLENVTIGETHLAVMTLLPERRRQAREAGDNFFSEFFVHAMRNKISVITTASSQLEGLTGKDAASDRRKLAEIISSETGELDRLVDGLDLLAGGQRPARRHVSLVGEISGAVKLARSRLNRPITIVPDEMTEQTTLAAPGSSLSTLAEAVLRSHTVQGIGASSRIRLRQEDDNIVVDVATLGDGSQTTKFHSQWKTYATRLADRLGFACSYEALEDGNLTTTISIPVEGKPTHV